MDNRISEIINKLEYLLQKGYSLKIFKGYKAINKTGVEKIIAELFATLEDDVIKANSYLDSKSTVINLQNKIAKSIQIFNYIFVNVKEIEDIIFSKE